MKHIILKTCRIIETALDHPWTKGVLWWGCVSLLVDPTSASVVGDMKAAVEDLQKEIFGSGWITVGKIAAAAVGGVMAIARSSAVPFAMGAGVAGGLHFFQKHTEAAATCLLDVAPQVANSLHKIVG